MGKLRRTFSKEFKISVLNEIDGGKALVRVARENELDPNQIRKWKSEFSKYGEKAFQGHGNLYKEDARIAELERVVGQLTMENKLLKKALNKLRMTD